MIWPKNFLFLFTLFFIKCCLVQMLCFAPLAFVYFTLAHLDSFVCILTVRSGFLHFFYRIFVCLVAIVSLSLFARLFIRAHICSFELMCWFFFCLFDFSWLSYFIYDHLNVSGID